MTASTPRAAAGDLAILLVMVPGMGIQVSDFHARGLVAAVEARRWPVAIASVDPGTDAYLDGSVENRLFDGIAAARCATGAMRVWLAGISLGCQAILRCVRLRPDVADGLMLLTPYLASTGRVAQVVREGGLRRWQKVNQERNEPDRMLLSWLATTPKLPRMLVGRALNDRFAATATMLGDILPAGQMVTVAGEHDWTSWEALWRLMLDLDPFEQEAAT
jgi:pimeloyl-ACP methyl ester carboxylesterase